MFSSIFASYYSVLLVVAVLVTTTVLSFGFALIYTFLKKRTWYYKDMPISFVVIPVVVVLLTLGVEFIVRTYPGDDSFAKYGRYAVALIGALLILKIRSEQRSVEDISYLFFSITYSILLGMGYLTYGLIAYVLGVAVIVASNLLFKKIPLSKSLIRVVITVPEDLDYESAFVEIFDKYAKFYETENIRLSDMGTIYKIAYNIELKSGVNTKDFIDDIRVRNGNLDVNVTLKRDITPKTK